MTVIPPDYDLSSYDFALPEEAVAQTPSPERGGSRLLVLDRASGATTIATFDQLVDFLPPGALLVANNSRVVPARVFGRKPSGGRVECLLLSPLPLLRPRELGAGRVGTEVECLLRASKAPRVGDVVLFDLGLRLEVLERGEFGRSRVLLSWGAEGAENPDETLGKTMDLSVPQASSERAMSSEAESTSTLQVPGEAVSPTVSAAPTEMIPQAAPGAGSAPPAARSLPEILAAIGRLPLPPYIQRDDSRETSEDRERYQTVYAASDKLGSMAAPTAGLHFTPDVMSRLRERGFSWAEVTLYVGYGTFSPVRCPDIRDHKMHAEYVEVPAATAEAVAAAKASGRPVVAVGTTSARSLEGAFAATGAVAPFSGWTDIFIAPGYRFNVVDCLLTNFHLPESSLLIMVSALAGRERVLAAYREALAAGFRFFSYGDAMLIV